MRAEDMTFLSGRLKEGCRKRMRSMGRGRRHRRDVDEAIDGEGADRRAAAPVAHQFGQDLANGWPDLKAGAGKTEAVEQARRGTAGADHRLVVGQVAFGTAPGPDEVRM